MGVGHVRGVKRGAIVFMSVIACATLTGEAPTPAVPVRAANRLAVETLRYTMADFGEVILYRPDREPDGVVLFLSDSDGWTPARDKMARTLAGTGLLVAGVSTPALLQAMAKSRSACNNANYPLIDLARDVQHRTAMTLYRKPVVLGYG
ncbi:MAG: hypothetical protein ABW169_13845 [Sphingobium sp.]